MRHLRFTIANLLGLVLFVAVGFAALRQADDLWDSALFTLTMGLLLASVLLAIHRAEGRRAYWLGFAVFGGAYIGASLIPPVEARLLTTRALAYLDSKVPGLTWDHPRSPVSSVAFSPDGRWLATDTDRAIRLWDVRTGRPLAVPIRISEHFVRIGHSLTALVLAFLGAHLSLSLHATGRRVAVEARDTPSASRSAPDGG